MANTRWESETLKHLEISQNIISPEQIPWILLEIKFFTFQLDVCFLNSCRARHKILVIQQLLLWFSFPQKEGILKNYFY